jgi:penicillin-binding protein 2
MKLNVSYNESSLREIQNRAKLLYFALAFMFTLLVMRLIYLQVIQGETLYAFSEKNLLKEIRVQPPRGTLYDRNHNILAENLPNFALTISPQYVKDLDALATAIGKIIHRTKDDIISDVKKSRRMNGLYRPVVLKNFLGRTEMNQLELLKIDFQGLDIEELIFRSYPYGEILSHVLGYTGEVSESELPKLREQGETYLQQGDVVGKSGIEEKYDNFVRGTPGTSYFKVDARGREAIGETLKFLGHIEDLAPKSGQNIETTLDIDLMKAAHESFMANGQTGALVAINKFGEVLALYNAPSFDPNLFSKGISMEDWSALVNNPVRPLRNRAIQDHYSPGSAFKPLVAVAALQTKQLTENTYVFAPPTFSFGGRVYHDHTKTGQGNITITQAIEMSSNVFFYKQGLNLGVDAMALYAKALGIGKPTGIDLKGEAPGLMPTTQWKKEKRGEPWQEGENLSTAIGQGFVLLSTIQLANAYMSIANEGLVYKPMVVRRIFDANNKVVKDFSPILERDMGDKTQPYYVSPENFKIVKKGLFLVANGAHGTARWAKVPGFTISGKTGTAQVRGFSSDEIYKDCNSRPKNQRHNGWYVAFGPSEKPELTVAVLTENSCLSRAAVPIVRDLFIAYGKKYLSTAVSANEDAHGL